jgi:hypothetical protein
VKRTGASKESKEKNEKENVGKKIMKKDGIGKRKIF